MTQMRSDEKIQVLLVDDHVIVRKGLRALLAESDDIEVIGEAGNGLEAIREVDELEPDVVLMDLVMPEMDGVEAIALISAQHPGLRILVITTFSTDEQVFAVIKAGAHGYLLKDAGSGDLTDAIRQVHRGEPSLHPLVARKLMQEVAQPTTQKKDTRTVDRARVGNSAPGGHRNEQWGYCRAATCTRSHGALACQPHP